MTSARPCHERIKKMFNWLSKSTEAPAAALDLEAIKKQDVAILFKHSSTCPVSWAAQAEVKRFSAKHPEVPVYTLIVQEQRDLSRQVAEWSGIRHESPQVFVLKQGKIVANDSHEGVNVDFLTDSLKAS